MTASTETGVLILKSDSTQVVQASKDLDKLTGSAEGASKSVDGLAESAVKAEAAAKALATTTKEGSSAVSDVDKAASAASEKLKVMYSPQITQSARSFRESQQEIIAGLLGYGTAVDRVAAKSNTQADISARGAALMAAEDRTRKAATLGVAEQTGALSKLLGQIDPTVAGYERLDAMQAKLAAFKKSGAISGDDYTQFSGKIAGMRQELDKAGAATHALTLNSSMARRELGRLGTDLAMGNYGRLTQTTLTLANYTGVMGKVFSATGLSILGVTAIVGGFTASLYKAAQADAELEKAIILSGNAPGMTSEQMKVMASSYATYYTSASKVLDLQKGLLATGSVNTQNFREATQAAISFGEATGQSQKEVISTFDALAKDPVSTLEKINQLYGWITPAVLDHVKALADQGDKANAVAEAFRAINDAASDTASAEQKASTTIDNLIAKWKAGASAISGYYQKLVNGISPTEQFQIARSTYELHLQSTKRNSVLDRIGGQVYTPEQLQAEEASLKAMAATIQAQRDAAALGAQTTDDNKAGTQADSYYDSHFATMDKVAKKQKELNDLTATYEQMWAHTDSNNARLAGVQRVIDAEGKATFFGGNFDRDTAAINKKFADHTRKTKADPFASLDGLVQKAAVRDDNFGIADKQTQQVTDILAIVDAGAKLIASGHDVAKVQALVATGVANTNEYYAKQAAQLKSENLVAIAQYQASLDKQNDALQRTIKSQIDKIGMGDKEFTQQQQINDLYVKGAEALTQLQLKRDGVAAKGGDTSVLDANIAALQANTDKQVQIVTAGYKQMDAARADWTNGLRSSLANYLDQASDVAGQSATLFTNAFNGMGDSLANFATTGKLNFKGLVASILSDLAKMEMRIALSKILQQVLGMFAGSYGNSSGNVADVGVSNGTATAFNPYANAKGGVYSSPSLSTYSGQIVNQPTAFKFASGAGIMGEAGPEAIMPLSRGSDGKLGVKAAGGGNTINIKTYVTVDSNGSAKSQTSSDSSDAMAKMLAAQMEAKAKEVVLRATQPGGILWKQRVGA